MHRFSQHIFLTLLLLVPASASAEYIERFSSTIDVQRDSSFVVTEEITYVFSEDRHGIYRDILTNHPQEASAWYRERFLDVEILDVTMDDEVVPYEVEERSDTVSVVIGDPDQTVSGLHLYTVTYVVRGGLSYLPEGGAEIYWNATGHDWSVPIRAARVALSAPSGVFTNERACYRGFFGNTASCTVGQNDEGAIIFGATELGPGEGVTVAQGIDPQSVERVVLEETRTFWFWILAAVIWFGALGIFIYRYKTAHQTGRAIIPQYEPYADLRPMYTGLLYDGTLHPQDVTASIVYLAEQGYFKIKKIERKVLFLFEVDDYEILLQKDTATLESPFQKSVLELLFGKNPSPGSTVTLSDLKKNTSKQKENQKIMRELKRDLEHDLAEAGFYQVHLKTETLLVIVGVLAIGGFFLFQFMVTVLSLHIAAAVGVLLLSLVALSFLYKRRTRKGYEARDHLEGFRQFLSITGKERFAFHNAPDKNPEQFLEYLPYAIALGVERQWAQVFSDITIPTPEWYESRSGGANFSATNLSASIGAFSTAFASSSGSSGSSGGGSAGGGGGGGGGGSW